MAKEILSNKCNSTRLVGPDTYKHMHTCKHTRTQKSVHTSFVFLSLTHTHTHAQTNKHTHTHTHACPGY